VTGVEVVIGNCLPEVHKILPDFKNSDEKISNNSRWTLVAICLVISKRMSLSGTVMEIWPFEVLPERLFQEQRSLVGPQYYTDFIYSSSLR